MAAAAATEAQLALVLQKGGNQFLAHLLQLAAAHQGIRGIGPHRLLEVVAWNPCPNEFGRVELVALAPARLKPGRFPREVTRAELCSRGLARRIARLNRA